MKKLAISMFVFMFLLVGCMGIQFTPPTQDFLMKATAIKLGCEVAKKNPQIIPKVNLYAEVIKSKGMSFDAMKIAEDFIASEIKDPADKLILGELMKMIVIDTNAPDFDLGKIQIAVDGFVLGVNLVR